MDSDKGPATVVIDNGSWTCKAGFAGRETPKVEFTPVVARHKEHYIMAGLGDPGDFYVGDDYRQRSKQELMDCTWPVVNRIVWNNEWDDMERVFHYTFSKKLDVLPEEHPLLLTEAPLNSKESREKMTQIMFEKFLIPTYYTCPGAVLSLYPAGRTNGIVCDSGYGMTHIVPVREGNAIPHAIDSVELAGRTLTAELRCLLTQRALFFQSREECKMVHNFKETMCYVALDFDEVFDKGRCVEKCVELPDGRKIRIGDELFCTPEILFRPWLSGLENRAFQEMVHNTVQKCDSDIRPDLYRNIILAGGSTLFPGMAERMTKEVSALAPSGTEVNVIATPDRKYSVWKGGSILASMSTFQQMCITKQEYEEHGASIVHKKCP